VKAALTVVLLLVTFLVARAAANDFQPIRCTGSAVLTCVQGDRTWTTTP
jgi:hypothetical protein